MQGGAREVRHGTSSIHFIVRTHKPKGFWKPPLRDFSELQFRIPGMELKNPSRPEIRKTPPGVRPRKYEKNTEGPKMTVFVFFLYFSRIFGARPRGGEFRHFFVFFRISVREGFLSSKPGTRGIAISESETPLLRTPLKSVGCRTTP